MMAQVQEMSDGRGWSSGPSSDGGPMAGVFCYLWSPQPQVSGWRACREVWTAGHIVSSTFFRSQHPTTTMILADFSVSEWAAFREALPQDDRPPYDLS